MGKRVGRIDGDRYDDRVDLFGEIAVKLMLVLGIDPGSRVTGYGLIEKRNNSISCI